MQRQNTESLDLINHAFNRNKISVGDPVYVNTHGIYPAIVKGLRLDSKNRKIFAYLKNFSEGLPSRVDVCDCKRRENNI